MHEVLPQLYHWRARHPEILIDVDCSCGHSDGVTYLLDPLVPAEGLDPFQRLPSPPTQIYMTNRLHDRSCATFAAAFGARIWCNRHGLHEWADGGLEVTGFDAGDELPGGVKTIDIGIICADETALWLPIDAGVLAIADSFIRQGQDPAAAPIGFVPDDLIGDDPEGVKQATKARFLQLCDELDFDHLLFAHGAPIIGAGKQALRTFCAA